MEKIKPEMRIFDAVTSCRQTLLTMCFKLLNLLKLSKAPYVRLVEWSKWHVFWAEENVVPKRHPDSYYWQAKQWFISKVPLLPAHVNPVSPGLSAESAANSYEFAIRQQLKSRTVQVSRSTDCPRFDLILLSLGSGGHVASLYPNQPVLEEESQWVACVSKDESCESVTLTLPVINAAANVTIVASGLDTARPFMDTMWVGSPFVRTRPKWSCLEMETSFGLRMLRLLPCSHVPMNLTPRQLQTPNLKCYLLTKNTPLSLNLEM
ncbi:hypothetical protein GOBAR_AA21793 [Gossypium barbadense]|uniref:Glucosamine/galactosamine-6-phosphate isomerase domain-containing protein n=1 Tax=Gossypium barbadense TaxID=3634 RepID=A0A2P5X6A4_GOSBA|nr:hypothetical protein GOBAR_AA21793 [Gossypium barbadense]